MANESLSQTDIDALFGGDTPPTEAVSPEAIQQDVQVYDFHRPALISKDRRRSLLAMYGLFTKSLEGWISGRVRDQLEFDLQSVEQLTFGEFTLALPATCASYIVKVPETGHQGVIDFGQNFAFYIVDRLLGGSSDFTVPDRSFTAMERLVVRIVAERAAQHLTEVWSDHVPLDLVVDGFESIPEMLQVANREDPVLVASIGISMVSKESLLLLCLPFATLDKFFTGTSHRRHQISHATPEERAADRGAVESAVRNSRLQVGARLPAFSLPIGKIASFKPGEIVPTGLSPDSELEIYVAGQKRFVGTPGRIGQTLAVHVNDIVVPEPENLIGPQRMDR